MAKKQLTVNEMIYKTLTTKVSKIPKYKDELEALGYKLNRTHAWSTYDYWGIETGIPGRILLISSGYDKKKRLYKTAKHIKTNDITKVDFVNLIKVNRLRDYDSGSNKIEKYKSARYDYNFALQSWERQKAAYEKAKSDLEYYAARVQREKERLDAIIASFKK